jgi:type II secretory pathway pseudopilin PulG
MKLRNSRGLTLVELLVAVTLSFSVMAIVSGVLLQSFRNMEIADSNINLRQEANILLAMITKSHMSPIDINNTRTNSYTISYNRINSDDWEMFIGDQHVSNLDFDITLELEQKIPGETTTRSYIINSSTITSKSFEIIKRQPLNIKKVTLINKKDSTKKFEISTIISRL